MIITLTQVHRIQHTFHGMVSLKKKTKNKKIKTKNVEQIRKQKNKNKIIKIGLIINVLECTSKIVEQIHSLSLE